MLRVENVRGLRFQCLYDAADAFETRASRAYPSNRDTELLDGLFPKPAGIECEHPHICPGVAQSLNCIKQLPLCPALAKRSGDITNFELRKSEHGQSKS